MGALARWGDYAPGTPQRQYFDAYISKMGAPGIQAQTRASLVDPTIKRWEDNAAHQKALETIARTRNDNTAAYHAKHAAYWDGLLRLRQQAIDKDPNEIQVIDRIGEMLQSNDPQQVDLAQQWLDRKNVPVTRE